MTRATPIAPELTVVDGHVTTTSLDVARHFGKRHGHVLRTIRDLAAQLPPERQPNFGLTSLEVIGPNGGTRSEPAYRITRDGFTLLAMGFTGARALEFKLAYLDAFNRMEAELSQQQAQALAAPAAPAELTINPTKLLLSGQSEPVPLKPEQYRLLDQRAWELAGDARVLLREHLLRAVAYRTSSAARDRLSDAEFKTLLQSITLGQALAHEHFKHVRSAELLIRSSMELIAQAHARMQADLRAAGVLVNPLH